MGAYSHVIDKRVAINICKYWQMRENPSSSFKLQNYPAKSGSYFVTYICRQHSTMAETLQITSEGINWIDVCDPSNAEVIELSKEHNLNRLIVQDSLQPEHLPKYEVVEDVNFMILRFNVNAGSCNAATIQELTDKITIFYTDQLLITIHKTEAPFLDPIRKRCKTPGKCLSTTEVLSKIVWSALETFDQRADYLSQQVDVYENEIMRRKTNNDQMEALYLIKREAALAHKVLLLMQEPINHIFPKPGEEPLVQDVKDQHLKMRTLYGQVLEEVNNLMNLFISFSAQKTNDVMKVLTIFSVFFMPLTFIVGIYGMNFEFMPELRQRWGYPGVLILMVIVTVIIYFWFKKKKWL
jgi:magnesium transporter